jgi:cephalosporin-C deacetylase-like acetyl esterase
MTDKPVLWGGRANDRQVVRAARALEHTENAIHTHALETAFLREIEHIDAEALAEVVKGSLKLEIAFYDEAIAKAASSAAKAQLIADKLSILSKTNSARIARRFGR